MIAPLTAILSKQLLRCHSSYSLFVLKRNIPEAEHILKLSTSPPEDRLLPSVYSRENKIIGLCFLIHDHLNIHFLRLHFSVFLCFIQDTMFQQTSQA